MKLVFFICLFEVLILNTNAQWEKILEVKRGDSPVKIPSVLYDQDLGIFAGTEHMGLFRSQDRGVSWIYKGLASENSRVKRIVPDNDDRLLVLTNRIFCSSDSGNTWQQFNIMNINSGSNETIRTFKYDTLTENIYAGAETDLFYISTNRGESWVSLALLDPGCWCGGNIEAIESAGEQFILVGVYSYCIDMGGSCYRHFLYKSLNGFIWYEVLNRDIKNILTIDDNLIIASASENLFRSTNKGDSWSMTSFNKRINVIKKSDEGTLYLGTENGVYYSMNEGTIWFHLSNEGLSSTNINDIDFDENGFILAAANDGLYRQTDSLTLIESNRYYRPSEIYLYQNYPNPFNPETTIKYNIPSESRVTLKIYDVLGRQVSLLIDEHKNEGEHEIQWRPGNMKSGIYFYRLNLFVIASKKSISATRKMIYLK